MPMIMDGPSLLYDSPTEDGTMMTDGPPPQIKWINASALYNRMQVNPHSLLLIDVRGAAAYQTMHIKGKTDDHL